MTQTHTRTTELPDNPEKSDTFHWCKKLKLNSTTKQLA
jgi:hypothetical protein